MPTSFTSLPHDLLYTLLHLASSDKSPQTLPSLALVSKALYSTFSTHYSALAQTYLSQHSLSNRPVLAVQFSIARCTTSTGEFWPLQALGCARVVGDTMRRGSEYLRAVYELLRGVCRDYEGGPGWEEMTVHVWEEVLYLYGWEGFKEMDIVGESWRARGAREGEGGEEGDLVEKVKSLQTGERSKEELHEAGLYFLQRLLLTIALSAHHRLTQHYPSLLSGKHHLDLPPHRPLYDLLPLSSLPPSFLTLQTTLSKPLSGIFFAAQILGIFVDVRDDNEREDEEEYFESRMDRLEWWLETHRECMECLGDGMIWEWWRWRELCGERALRRALERWRVGWEGWEGDVNWDDGSKEKIRFAWDNNGIWKEGDEE